MTLYLAIKYLHISCAVITITGFVLRGLWMMTDSPLLAHKLTRRLPHINDALLLTTALIMVFMSAQYPFVLSWLTAKVIALVVYILLGMVALKWGKTRLVKTTFWFLAVMTFVYIVSVALTRTPEGLLSYF